MSGSHDLTDINVTSSSNNNAGPTAGPAFSRRSLLAGSGLAGLGAFVSGSPLLHLFSPPVAAAQPRTPPRLGDSVPPAPLQIQASCQLSEDYFLTDAVVVGQADRILPFARADGTVETLVLAGGRLAHLARDTSQVSGWRFSVIDTQIVTLSDAAVAASPQQGVQVMAVGQTLDVGTLQASTLALEPDGTWSITSTGELPNVQGAPINGGTTAAGDLYWYGWTQEITGKNIYYTFWKWDGTGTGVGVNNGRPLMLLTFPTSSGASIDQIQMLYDTRPNRIITGFLAAQITTNNPKTSGLFTFPQQGSGASGSFYAPDSVRISDATELLWGYVTPNSNNLGPALLYRQGQAIGFQNETGGWIDFGTPQVSAGAGQVAPWLLNGLYAFTVIENNTAAAVTQYAPPPVPAITDPIPLWPGIQSVHSLPTDPTQGTLFCVDVDDILNVATKNPDTGMWTLTPISQDGESWAQIVAWRTLIRVLDNNGNPVGGANVQLSSDQPVGCWQSDRHIVLGTQPQTLTADTAGHIIFSIPAIELDTSGLTATPINPDNSLAAPFAITPDTDLRAFFAGDSSLPDIGQLTPDALQADDSPVQPYLAAIPGSPSDAATSLVAALNHLANVGLDNQPGNGIQSTKLDLSGDTATFTTSTDPNAYTAVQARVESSTWWSTAQHDLGSVLHGIRHAALSVDTLVTSWNADAQAWTIHVLLDIGGGLQDAATWVVNSWHDAVHAISGLLAKVGADLAKAWKWLMHRIFAALRQADVTATQLMTWFDQIPDQITNLLDQVETIADGFFLSQKERAHAAIQTLANETDAALGLGTAAPLPDTTSNTGSNTATEIEKVIQALEKGEHYASKAASFVDGAWLMHKLQALLPQDQASGPTAVDGGTQVLIDLENDFTDAANTFVDLVTLVWTTFQDLSNPAQFFSSTTISTLFGQLDTFVDDLLQLADDLVHTLLDMIKYGLQAFANLVNYEVDVSALADLFKLAQINPSTSLAHVLSLAFAFPATVIWNAINQVKKTNYPLLPTDAQSGLRRSRALQDDRLDPWGAALNVIASGTMVAWTITSAEEDSASGTPPKHALYMDVAAPVALAICGWPAVGTTTPPPFVNTDAYTKSHAAALLIPNQIVSLVPALYAALDLAQSTVGYKPSTQVGKLFTPGLTTVAGVAVTILSSIWNWANDANGAAKAIGLLGNLPYAIALLGTDEAAEISGGLAKPIKTGADLALNLATCGSIVAACCKATGG